MHWHKKFSDMVTLIASWSKDPSTKVGAVIVDNEHNVRSIGYNGFPRDVNDDNEERWERPEKYLWTEHAERNAIYAAARHGTPIENCVIYLAWYPCADCARAIIQAGIKTVYINNKKLTGDTEKDERWKDHFRVSETMFNESGVDIITLDLLPNDLKDWENF